MTEDQQDEFLTAVEKMIDDLKAGRRFRKGLGVKLVQGHRSIYEMRWADDGRATFQYGSPVVPGETHITWRHIGSHDILQNP